MLNDAKFHATGRDGLKVTAVLDAFYESGRTGRTVNIDTSIF